MRVCGARDGRGLAAGEWTLASILKQAGYSTCQIGKLDLGEGDYSMPIAYRFDEMRNTSLYHLNAYTYTDPTHNPDFRFDDKEMMATWGNVIGAIECNAGGKWNLHPPQMLPTAGLAGQVSRTRPLMAR